MSSFNDFPLDKFVKSLLVPGVCNLTESRPEPYITTKGNMDTIQLKRIADAIEEILRIVKKDMEPRIKEKD